MANTVDDNTFQELLRTARAGDSRAYAEFLQAITPLIRMGISASIKADQRDDVVQEILISVHRALPTYNSKREFRPWLNAIIKFRKTDALRQNYARQPEYAADVEKDYAHHITINPEPTAGELKDITGALNQLGNKQRRVLELLRIKGFSIDEMAHKLGITANDVKVSAHRATARLRDILNAR